VRKFSHACTKKINKTKMKTGLILGKAVEAMLKKGQGAYNLHNFYKIFTLFLQNYTSRPL
jgi:hypothetical protein